MSLDKTHSRNSGRPNKATRHPCVRAEVQVQVPALLPAKDWLHPASNALNALVEVHSKRAPFELDYFFRLAQGVFK